MTVIIAPKLEFCRESKTPAIMERGHQKDSKSRLPITSQITSDKVDIYRKAADAAGINFEILAGEGEEFILRHNEEIEGTRIVGKGFVAVSYQLEDLESSTKFWATVNELIQSSQT